MCALPLLPALLGTYKIGQDLEENTKQKKGKEKKRKEKKRKEKKRKEKKRNLNMLEASCSRASPFWDTWSSGGRASSAK